MRRKNRYYYLLTALAMGTLILAACGSQPEETPEIQVDVIEESDHDDDDEHEMTGDYYENAETITIVATEFGFEPASIELHAGEPVNIVLVNEGLIEHELQIMDFDFHVHTQPGESAMAGFIPDVSGTFEFGCHLPGHYEAGMVGEVEVAAAE